MGHDMLMLGLDAGGTSTRAVLTTAVGECIGYGVGGPGNPISAGARRAADGVLDAISMALARSSVDLAELDVITAAMAGQRAAEGEGEWLRRRLRSEGFVGRLTFESDLLATYSSGSAQQFGYAVVAGTGACAVRVSDGHIESTVDGVGWLLGDRGSGFWIGHRVAEAAVRDLDGAGPATALTRGVLEHLGIAADAVRGAQSKADAGQGAADAVRVEGRSRALEQVITALYAARPIELAALAPLAFAGGDSVAAADPGVAADPVADAILRRAGEHLAESLTAVLTEPGPLVVGGSVLFRSSPVRDAFMEHLGHAAAGLNLLPVVDGAVGAGMLALRAGGAAPSERTLLRLNETVALLR